MPRTNTGELESPALRRPGPRATGRNAILSMPLVPQKTARGQWLYPSQVIKSRIAGGARGERRLIEVRRWLEDRGLERHAALFEKLGIDFARFAKLRDSDFARFGLPPAARTMILREIAITKAGPSGHSTGSRSAERRQLTIMFCDLVNSVGLSVRLDPEDLRDLIVAYQRACARSVERYGGYIARYVGDGILVYFGYPLAYEDNAERAMRAALDLVREVGRLNSEQLGDGNIRVRIGIATGLVVVGSTDADGVSDPDAVVGEAANLAARLQGIAESNTVVVSAATRQLAMESFEYLDLGSHDLKGFATPVSAYQVIGQRQITRLQARGGTSTSFVGRSDEIALLLDGWRRATAQSGQAVALVGPAGIGKSRIVAEAVERVGRQDASAPAAVILQCSPYYSNVPLYPIVHHLARLTEIDAQDSISVKLGKVAKLLDADPPRIENVELIAELLGVELALDSPTGALAPATKRQLTIDTLLDWLTAQSARHAVMIVFEDAQWIDPTSRLLLGRLVQWAKSAAALVVLTVRAETSAAAEGLLKDTGLIEPNGRHADHAVVREIRELNAADGKKLAVAAAGEDSAIAAAQLNAIVRRSGGVPLYLEQLVKASAGGFDVSPRPATPDRASAVPSMIDDALMAQLDRLGAAKEIAQHAAAIGPEFQLDLLARIMSRSADRLMPLLDDLTQSRIIERGASPRSFRFRHSLIHDISYRSLLRRKRRELHLLVAAELSDGLAEAGVTNDDLIAQHYARGDAHELAIHHWRRGASSAISRSANEEAIGMLQSALASLKKLRGTGQPDVELDLVLTMAMAMRSVRGYSAPEVEQGLSRARELSVTCGDFNTQFSVEWGLFQCVLVKGDLEGARRIATSLAELANQDPGAALVDAYIAQGMAAFNAGEFEAAVKYLEAGVKRCQPETDQPRFLTHGQNAGLFCLSYLSRAQCHLGLLDQGRASIERARSIAAKRSGDPGHVHSILNVTIHAVRAYHLCGDLEAERRLANETAELARRNHYAYYEALAKCHLGWVTGMEGDLESGIEILNHGIGALKDTGTAISLAGYHLLLSQLYMLAGHRDEATRAQAIAADSRGQHFWDADIERARGNLNATDWAAAEAAYRSSLAISHRQRGRLSACKAAVSLAQLLRERGRRPEAVAVLEECLGQLTEGDDVMAIRQARSLLGELGAGRKA